VLRHFLPVPFRVSRRHLLKAVAVAVGALSTSLSKTARAQQNGQGGSGWGGDGQGGNGQGGDCQDGNSQGRWDCCFLRGTLIRAASGYRAIETLAVGDLLPTQFSGIATIRKIISFTVRKDDLGCWPDDCRLVRISAGALDDGIPARDLFVTHTHAVFLNQVLIPIASLVNNKTISFHDEIGLNSAEYFHLEFDSHDVVDAEGALCESFRDEATELCAPLALNGGRAVLWSHLRNAASPFVDRRQPFDLIRDGLDTRAELHS
jgi:Hint domain